MANSKTIRFNRQEMSKGNYADLDFETQKIPSTELVGNPLYPSQTRLIYLAKDSRLIDKLIAKYGIKVLSKAVSK